MKYGINMMVLDRVEFDYFAGNRGDTPMHGFRRPNMDCGIFALAKSAGIAGGWGIRDEVDE
jgi:hypothetical protein